MPPFRTETSRGVEFVPGFPDGHESAFAGRRATSCFRPDTLGPVLLKIQGKYNGKGRNLLISLIAVILFSMKTINSEQ
jgi:hypothetical protein